jgi:ADP-ribose pyrophosphatase
LPPETPRVINSRTPYEGHIFQVGVDRIRLGTREHEVDVELVRHGPSVGIVAMPSERSLMLVRQYRHAAGNWLWELPAGSVDAGERPEEAARRECHEELGLVAGVVESLGAFFPLPGYCTELMTFFKITRLRAPAAGDPEAHLDDDEEIEAETFEIDAVWRMVRSGTISDLKTAAALTLLASS